MHSNVKFSVYFYVNATYQSKVKVLHGFISDRPSTVVLTFISVETV